MKKYSKKIEDMMCLHYDSLSEKDKRHYAAIESVKLDHGGINYISELFGCCRQTVSTGIHELAENDPIMHSNRIRREGAGRMSVYRAYEDINEVFLKCD